MGLAVSAKRIGPSAALAMLAVCSGPTFAATYVCVVESGESGKMRFPRIDAADRGEAHCRAEEFGQRPGYRACVPAAHAQAANCVEEQADPVLDRRAPAPGGATGVRKVYRCPVPGTAFQEWLEVEAASAAEIVSGMNQQTRNFTDARQCLSGSVYAALTGRGAGAVIATPPPPGTLGRAEILATAQALADLRIERVRNIERRRDVDETPAVMARLQPIEASLAAEWTALSTEPVARFRQVLAVRDKYQPVFGYLRQQLSEQGPQNARSPVLALARRLEPASNAQIVAAMGQPAVRAAWIAGDLQVPLDLVPRAERREWAADRSAAVLARDAVAQTGATVLFMTRRDDLQQSRREREQADGFARWGEPTAHEIGLALLRAVSSNGGHQVTPAEAERIGPTHLLLETSNASIRYVTRAVHVHKTGCTSGGGGWSCEVRLWIHDFMRGLSQESLAALGMTAVHRAEIAFGSIGIGPSQLAGQPARLALVATRDGWTAPQFAAAIAADEQRVGDQMQRMAAKAQDEERCALRNIQRYGWDNNQPCF